MAHARGQTEEPLVGEARRREGAEADASVDQRGRHGERQAELRLVRRARPQFSRAWLADDRHFARRHVTLHIHDRIRLEMVLLPQANHAVDVRVVEMATRVRLEADARRFPCTPKGVEHLRDGRRAHERAVEAKAPLEHGRRAARAARGERRGEDARMRCPPRVQPLHAGAVLEELHQARGKTACETERVRQATGIEPQELASGRCGGILRDDRGVIPPFFFFCRDGKFGEFLFRVEGEHVSPRDSACRRGARTIRK